MENAALEQIMSIQEIRTLGFVTRNGMQIDPEECKKNDVVTDIYGSEYTIINRDGNMVTLVNHTASSTRSATSAVSKGPPATPAASKGGMKKRRAHKRYTKKRHTKKHRTHKYRARK